MNKNMFFSFLFLLVLEAQAFFSIGFNVTDVRVRPAAEVVPMAHVGFDVPLSHDGPRIGLGVSLPLGERVFLDDADSAYWSIYNDTDFPIRVYNSCECKVVRPGMVRSLQRAGSFRFYVSIDGIERVVRSDSHYITVRLNRRGAIVFDCD